MFVHGNVYDFKYAGSNNLLANGAKCILNVNDILKYYPQIEKKECKKEEKIVISDEYKDIYNELIKGVKDINLLSRKLNVNISELNSKLLFMEIERSYNKRKWKFLQNNR